MNKVQATEVNLSYKALEFHVNSHTLSSSAVQAEEFASLFPFAYWYYIAARTTMGIVIAITASGGQFGVTRRWGVRTESIVFRYPRVIRGRRGKPDRSVRRRSACEEFLARGVWMID